MSLRSRFQSWLNNAEARRDARLQRAKTQAERDEIRADFQRHKTNALADLRQAEARLAEAEARKRRAKQSTPSRFSLRMPKKKPVYGVTKKDRETVEGLKKFYKPKRVLLPEQKREKSPFEDW